MAPSEPPPLLSRRLLDLILALAALVSPTSAARKIPASVTPISRDLYLPQVRRGKVRRKRMRSSEYAVSTRVAAIIASKSCHKTGKRRGCEGASSLPLLVTGRPPSQEKKEHTQEKKEQAQEKNNEQEKKALDCCCWSVYGNMIFSHVQCGHISCLQLSINARRDHWCCHRPLCQLEVLLLHLVELQLPLQRATFIRHNPITGPQDVLHQPVIAKGEAGLGEEIFPLSRLHVWLL
ncbi:uncharacterized protein [Aegilops tauschii subsp. strangulata]|uniref:uncharacterized protein isoform X1 n=2 Tax=Aegilops tauschii subsp. strangulata TaxID=200361 RepID=UPI001ABC7EB3|nr:uncharacterized protein LOC109780887 isoform X1 [Aegilops tauschii subsp. strangulata]